MSWQKITGQERVKNILQRAIIENKVAHSYCFWGIDGCGKDALAIEFAKAHNCLSPIVRENTISACDECENCKSIDSLQNPNVQLLFSLPTPKNSSSKDENILYKMSEEQLEEIKQQIALKAKNHYHKISISGANQIKIASVREIKKNLSMSSITAGRRFIIISNADELTSEASNAFLKTLEEPNDDITIILTTSRIESILPTILSRSQQIHCSPIPDELIQTHIIENFNKSIEEAKIISVFAQGSYQKAIEYLDEDMQAFRETAINAFRYCLVNNYRIKLLKTLDPIFKLKNKKKLEQFITLLMLWLRDAVILNTTRNKNLIINIDQVEALELFVNYFGKKDLPACIEKLELAISRIPKNVMTELILMDLFLDLRNILLKK